MIKYSFDKERARMHEATRLNYELLTSYNYQVFED